MRVSVTGAKTPASKDERSAAQAPKTEKRSSTGTGRKKARVSSHSSDASAASVAVQAPAPAVHRRQKAHRHRQVSPSDAHQGPPKKAKAPKPGKPAHPGTPSQASTPSPPNTAGGGDPYTVARQFCGDRSNASLVPQEFRDNPELLAQAYAQYFDPDHLQAAHDGCLAGLHDLGL